MVDTSGIRTDWQNVSEADWQVNNAKAQANRITAEPLNALGQAIIDLSDEVGGGGGGGVTDHGALTGLADDDHPQYLTQLRGDNRYYTKAQTDGLYMPQGGVILADVAHTKTASQNRTALIAAINAAQAVGGTVLLPPVPAGQWILLDGPCPITAGGISVRGAGIRQTRIRQTAWIEPIFDVRAPDVEISNMTCEQGPYGTIDASQFRGEPRTSYNSAVWAGADRVDVHDMRVVNFVSGVHFAAWDVAVGAVRTPLKDCSAHRIQCVSVVFGLLAVGVDGFDWSEITGSYSINGTSTPPHLVYFSDFIGGVSIDNSAGKGGSSRADGGTGSSAYQFKVVCESLIGDVHARGCAGFLYALNCADVTFTALRRSEEHTSELQSRENLVC